MKSTEQQDKMVELMTTRLNRLKVKQAFYISGKQQVPTYLSEEITQLTEELNRIHNTERPKN